MPLHSASFHMPLHCLSCFPVCKSYYFFFFKQISKCMFQIKFSIVNKFFSLDLGNMCGYDLFSGKG